MLRSLKLSTRTLGTNRLFRYMSHTHASLKTTSKIGRGPSDNTFTCGRSCAAPNEQLSPIVNGLAWRTAYQNASTVWPERLRPDRSVSVIEIISGSSRPTFASASIMAGLGVMGVGEALRDAGAAVPQGPEHDRALIDAWAQALGMSSWYAWRPYKILS